MIKIFKYIPAIDAFIVDSKFKEISDKLGLSEWNEVVCMGRFFTMEARYQNERRKLLDSEDYIQDLDERIEKVKTSL